MITNMALSQRTMWHSCLVACSLIAAVAAQGKDYLPPSKGYNYPPPSVPFPNPTGNNGVKQPPPPVYRPPPPAPTQRPSYLPPTAPPSGPHEHHDEHQHHDEHHHHEPGMPFDFAYAVNEDGNDYSHNAVSDGDVTRGEYRVALPDGRTQIVKYTADWKNGFNAEVTYEGEARYPDQPAGGYPAARPANPAPAAYLPPGQGNGGYQY